DGVPWTAAVERQRSRDRAASVARARLDRTARPHSRYVRVCRWRSAGPPTVRRYRAGPHRARPGTTHVSVSDAREKCIDRGLKCKIIVIYATTHQSQASIKTPRKDSAGGR